MRRVSHGVAAVCGRLFMGTPSMMDEDEGEAE